MVDGWFGGLYLKLGEQARADAHDHRQHQHLDAGRHHVAQHLLGEKCGLVPERERHQHEAGKRGQLELDQRDEKLDRQHEEAQQDDQPSEEHHDDGRDVHEDSGKPAMSPICFRIGAPASMPTFASRPGCRKFSMLRVEPLAVRPSPAKERNTMPANQLKLPMM